MKIKIKIIQLLAIVSCLTLSVSCMDDLGNYNYNDINEVTVSGIDSTYVTFRFDNLVINPELELSQDTNTSENYSYRWVAVNESAEGGQEKFELSTDKNLDKAISLAPDKYSIYYFVKDLSTGIEFQYKSELEVITSTYEGWLVLSDTNTASQLDMVSLLDGSYKPFYNVLQGSDLALSGEAKFVYTCAYSRGVYGLYVSTTGNGTTRVDANTFDWSPLYTIANEFLTPQPANLEVDNVVANTNGYSIFTFVDNNAYYYNSPKGIAYSSPINTINGVRFNVSAMFGKGPTNNSQKYAILFDTENKRFVRAKGATVSTIPEASSTLFNYNDLSGMELVYMISNEFQTLGGAATFAILKDTVTAKFYLAIFNATTSNQLYYEEITATDFNLAEHIAINPYYGHIFYNVGGKIYEYDIDVVDLDNDGVLDGGKTYQMLDKGSDEITMLKFHDFFSEKAEYIDMQRQLIVGSYNGSSGTLEFYEVPNQNQALQLRNSFSGFGKIKSVSYRER